MLDCKWTEEEQRALARAHATLGNRWLAISKQIAGRSAAEIKNFWHATVRSTKGVHRSAFLHSYVIVQSGHGTNSTVRQSALDQVTNACNSGELPKFYYEQLQKLKQRQAEQEEEGEDGDQGGIGDSGEGPSSPLRLPPPPVAPLDAKPAPPAPKPPLPPTPTPTPTPPTPLQQHLRLPQELPQPPPPPLEHQVPPPQPLHQQGSSPIVHQVPPPQQQQQQHAPPQQQEQRPSSLQHCHAHPPPLQLQQSPIEAPPLLQHPDAPPPPLQEHPDAPPSQLLGNAPSPPQQHASLQLCNAPLPQIQRQVQQQRQVPSHLQQLQQQQQQPSPCKASAPALRAASGILELGPTHGHGVGSLWGPQGTGGAGHVWPGGQAPPCASTASPSLRLPTLSSPSTRPHLRHCQLPPPTQPASFPQQPEQSPFPRVLAGPSPPLSLLHQLPGLHKGAFVAAASPLATQLLDDMQVDDWCDQVPFVAKASGCCSRDQGIWQGTQPPPQQQPSIHQQGGCWRVASLGNSSASGHGYGGTFPAPGVGESSARSAPCGCAPHGDQWAATAVDSPAGHGCEAVAAPASLFPASAPPRPLYGPAGGPQPPPPAYSSERHNKRGPGGEAWWPSPPGAAAAAAWGGGGGDGAYMGCAELGGAATGDTAGSPPLSIVGCNPGAWLQHASGRGMPHAGRGCALGLIGSNSSSVTGGLGPMRVRWVAQPNAPNRPPCCPLHRCSGAPPLPCDYKYAVPQPHEQQQQWQQEGDGEEEAMTYGGCMREYYGQQDQAASCLLYQQQQQCARHRCQQQTEQVQLQPQHHEPQPQRQALPQGPSTLGGGHPSSNSMGGASPRQPPRSAGLLSCRVPPMKSVSRPLLLGFNTTHSISQAGASHMMDMLFDTPLQTDASMTMGLDHDLLFDLQLPAPQPLVHPQPSLLTPQQQLQPLQQREDEDAQQQRQQQQQQQQQEQ